MDFNDDGMWDWQCQEYDLGDDDTLDISNIVLNEDRADDFTSVFDAGTTPVMACGDMSYQVYNNEIDKDFGQYKETSSQVKRRRKLQFESEELGASIFNQNIPESCLRSKESKDSFEEGISETSQWVSGFSGGGTTTSSGGEALDPAYERWFADCLNDAEMFLCSDPSDVHIDITDLCDTLPPENNVVQPPPPVRTRGNVAFKGRKSSMKSPEKVGGSCAVVCPFEFIKPCSVQGEMTIKDINQRIRDPAALKLKNKKESIYPTSAISGKPVVGKTKIHTVGGKGSITIMRTIG